MIYTLRDYYSVVSYFIAPVAVHVEIPSPLNTYNIMLSDRPREYYETGRWSTAAREFSFTRLASLRLVFVFGRRVSIVSRKNVK